MSNLGAFPQDIIQEILKWSTVSSLLRFRPSFNIIDLSSLPSEVNPSALRKLDFPCPVQKSYVPYNFLGSINGLMCAAIGNRGFMVWNPSIRAQWNAPSTDFKIEPTLVLLSLGFGYDSVRYDYKVVRIVLNTTGGGGSTGLSVRIYSFKNGDWRRIGDPGYRILRGQPRGILLKNAVHWLVHRTSKDQYGSPPSIAALDMTDETFRRLTGPGFTKHAFMMSLANLDGTLCLCYTHSTTDEFDLWVMNEYGVEESWSRLIKLNLGMSALVPLTLSEHRKEILVYEDHQGHLLQCDVGTGLSEKKLLSSLPHAIGLYVPTLVRMDVENQ